MSVLAHLTRRCLAQSLYISRSHRLSSSRNFPCRFLLTMNEGIEYTAKREPSQQEEVATKRQRLAVGVQPCAVSNTATSPLEGRFSLHRFIT